MKPYYNNDDDIIADFASIQKISYKSLNKSKHYRKKIQFPIINILQSQISVTHTIIDETFHLYSAIKNRCIAYTNAFKRQQSKCQRKESKKQPCSETEAASNGVIKERLPARSYSIYYNGLNIACDPYWNCFGVNGTIRL